MNLNETEKQARALMAAHGVAHLDFAFDNGKRRLGATHFIGGKPIKITLSKHFVQKQTPDEVRDTVLHEIAHALAGRTAGHGPKWKAQARAIGANPQRCSDTTARPEAAVQGFCPNCQTVTAQMHRLPLRVYYCAPCVKSRKVRVGEPSMALKWSKNGRDMDLAQMPARYRAEWNGLRRRESSKPKSLEDFFRF